MADFSQDERRGKLHAPAGGEDLMLMRMEASEEMNGEFIIHVTAISDAHVELGPLMGQHLTVEIAGDTPDEPIRFFDGILTEANWSIDPLEDEEDEIHLYELTLRPWFELLKKEKFSKAFVDQTAQETIEEIFSNHASLGDAMFEFAIAGSTTTMAHKIQYQESSYDYVRRLMAHDGLNHYYKMGDGFHTMVITDDPSSYEDIPGESRSFNGGNIESGEEFHEWKTARQVVSTSVAMDDYNYQETTASRSASATPDNDQTVSGFEVFEYPGRYDDSGAGSNLATIHAEAIASDDNRDYARGTVYSMQAGQKVGLDDHPTVVDTFLCLKARHSFENGSYTAAHGSPEVGYSGLYEMRKADLPLRPKRYAREPNPPSILNAVVIEGSDTDPEDLGRVKVTYPALRGAEAFWCRVAHHWSGPSYGSFFTPRIDTEVLVGFLFDDINQPIVLGCLYNGTERHQYHGRQSEHLSGFYTETFGGGGYNSLMFRDQPGDELVEIHGQFDMDTAIENDRRTSVGRNHTENIGNNQSITIGNDQTIDVGKKVHLTAGDEIIFETGAAKITMKKDGTIDIEGKDVTVTASMKLKTDSGMDTEMKAGMNMKSEASMNYEAKGGMNTTVEGGIAGTFKGGATVKLEGGAMAQIQGGMVKIN